MFTYMFSHNWRRMKIASVVPDLAKNQIAYYKYKPETSH